MNSVKIYTTMLCPYCHAAKRLLTGKGVAFEEVDVSFSSGERRKMAELAGRTSVPQIWIGEKHVGGFDDLSALETSGELDKMLQPA